ncbi:MULTISPECIES: tRNA (guanine-N1)-methyltransferase [unclassified Leptolyngbya]|uniref:tRNA (guanine-N1)-methyltransferase n=1 Tax=unclassified Leptolyngbya TaxID=2650499 RepID=UPI001689FC95|nr:MULTISPECIES: tRNA (guanine-N1)-methyltransferase [unclassified Leptolyngbya]MBD1913275.1 tRNA (guanine-N1)-methyltransferase [Leptolyngbya sp. FACHB-8]MBD2153363.1 tRNA (guanine-N1)-methyltransferase [Leptolyngbya sp. FACHB-16]
MAPEGNDEAEHQEGKARFRIGGAFYRHPSYRARDLGVLAAAVYRAEVGRLRVLDSMAACGVRSLRYALESEADWVWANDGNPEVGSILRRNLEQALPTTRYQVTDLDANQVFFECYRQRDFYDLVDVDGFGSAAPHLSSALWAVALGGLLYITSTDGRAIGGRSPHSSLAAYGAYARSHPAVHEQGLRLLIGSAAQLAASRGLGIVPIFSWFCGQTWRVMLRLQSQTTLSETTYGFLGYCHTCGNYQTISWQKLGKARCPNDSHPFSLSGPMWLGALHSDRYLTAMQTQADTWNWTTTRELLTVMQDESEMPPYFFPLGEIGRRGKCDVGERSHLIQTLQSWGYRACRTHLNPQAIKTDAPLEVCIKANNTTQT